jgi:cytochrome c biogenesis factor
MMTKQRRGTVLLLLGVLAAVLFGLSALLDQHGNWGDPGQAVANTSWILFLLSALAFLVLAVRFALSGRKQSR